MSGVDEQAPIPEQIKQLDASLEERVTAAVDAKVGELLGPAIETALAPYVAKLEEIIAGAGKKGAKALAGDVEGELRELIEDVRGYAAHVEAKVHAVHNGVQRGIGITIPLPESAAAPAADATVSHAETAK